MDTNRKMVEMEASSTWMAEVQTAMSEKNLQPEEWDDNRERQTIGRIMDKKGTFCLKSFNNESLMTYSWTS